MAISAKPSRTEMVTDPAAHLCRQGLDICQSPARTSCNRQRGGYGWLRILARPTHGHAAKGDTCTGDVTISGPARVVSPWCKERPRHARAGQTQLRDGSPRRKAFSGRPGQKRVFRKMPSWYLGIQQLGADLANGKKLPWWCRGLDMRWWRWTSRAGKLICDVRFKLRDKSRAERQKGIIRETSDLQFLYTDTEFKTRFTKTTWSDTRRGLIRSPRDRASCVRQSRISQQRATSRALDKAGIGNVRPKETHQHPENDK
ncbi:hypothetical protein LB505_011175 [Fusarium chuoi]|nr:hypothetical protein LB505_011175 [Fusarium chuoi]